MSQPLLTGRQVIYTADITVQTKDIKTAVDQLAQLALGRGGVVFGEQVSLASKDPNNPGTASATVTLKVPPEALNQGGILDQIGRLGTELSRNETASDVSAQVADVNSREAAAQDSLARLRQLFQHAGNVADLATVENEIAQREADLESLEAQQRTFTQQVAQATITVNLVATPKVAPLIAPVKKAHVVGFVRGLRGGWHAFTRTVTGITTAVGALLPFLIVLLVLGLAALIVRRRLMARPPDDCDSIAEHGSGCLMHVVDKPRQHVGIGGRQHTVPEIEDVTARGPAARDDIGRGLRDDLPRRENHCRIEISLHRLVDPTRCAATSSGTRQSTPTTSAPASPISASSSPVPTPK